MNFRAIIYNSATLNAPKNILQFLFGVIIYGSLTGNYDIIKTVLAASGLSFGLGAIYLFNDLTDYEEDKKNQMKISWKAIANGSISVGTAKYLIVILSVLGTLFSFLSGAIFFSIYAAIIGLNLLYSYPAIRLKTHKNSSLIVITFIQLLKFSSGWFLFTTSLNGFPFPFVISLSVGYSLLFLYYKNNTANAKKIIKENKLRVYPLSLIMFGFLLISFFMYAFPVVFVLILGMSVPTILFYTLSKEHLGTKVNFAFMYAGLIIILLSFLLLSVPMVTATNDTLVGYSNQIKEMLKNVYLNK
ncbi:MAG: phosphoribose diphosphate:decaprenyl-phosphate phosphoribosyltransferase [Candidatus Methanofastidiosum methylothiophilum]|uniref:Phosphoribose diphosphate:decaprenyl-phosphate phosphoribosyltransferase n=1 Tax=Candidatus Methanofastidiosum methylothiophilum TaxID=1705564 RepID=A0A150ILA2_9EURY|nr:MAG: phosphoribose diphosphate:decaprenyl-phosphate phosphoribosyltransferase [Candidatus Methanofastidiosum methylthiophilus]KYC48033.1 MAG: phosphoribose diphosphate:decaprenyl-phosphate phosphoribosyltransferase [Candidatus Methanofastidiosum methylthiophilus]KYC50723.1 MAG: phosphoribose diphosphate:decaprenyl-phosphate phosphoribosyltransferase [Candidatus Methanofastidiosum methylthiophilus]